jgi:hypothetical protein
MRDLGPVFERRIGPQVIRGDAFTFECPVCAKRFRYDNAFEPLCTGPSESRDEHEPAVMRLLRADKKEIHPNIGLLLSEQPMIIL